MTGLKIIFSLFRFARNKTGPGNITPEARIQAVRRLEVLRRQAVICFRFRELVGAFGNLVHPYLPGTFQHFYQFLKKNFML